MVLGEQNARRTASIHHRPMRGAASKAQLPCYQLVTLKNKNLFVQGCGGVLNNDLTDGER